MHKYRYIHTYTCICIHKSWFWYEIKPFFKDTNFEMCQFIKGLNLDPREDCTALCTSQCHLLTTSGSVVPVNHQHISLLSKIWLLLRLVFKIDWVQMMSLLLFTSLKPKVISLVTWGGYEVAYKRGIICALNPPGSGIPVRRTQVPFPILVCIRFSTALSELLPKCLTPQIPALALFVWEAWP